MDALRTLPIALALGACATESPGFTGDLCAADDDGSFDGVVARACAGFVAPP
jgi:pimeloyl-CoA synthetase